MMRPDRSSTRLQAGTGQWTRPALQWLACFLAPSLAVLAVGVVAASMSDPDWDGTTPENISHSTQPHAWQPDIAVDSSGRVVVVWSDEQTGGRNIYTTDNEGGEWSAPQVVSATAWTSHFPDVLAVDDRSFVAWVEPPTITYEAEIGVNGVRSISSPVPLVDAQPRLAASTDRLHVVLIASALNIPDIYHASRLLAGTAWPMAKRIYTSTAGLGSWWPALAVGPDGETLHVVWEDMEPSKQSMVMYMSGTVSGADVDWAPAITLSTGITQVTAPDIGVDSGGNVHVVWGEVGKEGYAEQYVRYTRYDTAGGSWTTPAARIDPNPVQVNEESPTHIVPKLALWEDDQVEVCVAWYGFRVGDPKAEEVLLRCSRDGGGTWSSAATENVSRSTTDRGWEVSMRPSIAFDGSGRLHVVWQERAGDVITEEYEIYYAAAAYQMFLPLVVRNY
jgi:hypothetical protein